MIEEQELLIRYQDNKVVMLKLPHRAHASIQEDIFSSIYWMIKMPNPGVLLIDLVDAQHRHINRQLDRIERSR